MSIEVHIDWRGTTHLVGRLRTAERSAAVTFEYAREWLTRAGSFSIDPTSLPLGPSPMHGASLFGEGRRGHVRNPDSLRWVNPDCSGAGRLSPPRRRVCGFWP